MATVQLGDAELYYEEHGTESGVPLVLVHGFIGTGASWAPLVPEFADYRLVVPDLRGHGRSSGSVDTIHHQNFAEDLVSLLDHLGIDRAHFVGHSSGGMCLLFLAARHLQRVRTLSLVSATHTFDDHAKAQMRKATDELAASAEGIADIQRKHGPRHGDDYWQVLRQAFLNFTHRADELPFRADQVGWLTQPVLVLHGDRDRFFPVHTAVDLYEGLPIAELCIFPDTGHDLPFALPELFVAVERGFLKRHADA
jgi:pimeloyl-ACP methyl ester carboxylesterase